MSIIQVIIDKTTPTVIQGLYQFDRSNGGVFVPPSGTSFPTPAVAGEFFWRSDESILYRRDNTNSSWVPSSSGPGETSKAGLVSLGTFSGDPKKAAVTFTVPYANTSYIIVLNAATDGTRSICPAIESKTASGFTINLHTNNLANIAEVGWHTTTLGG
jgi:hypothetical protein